MTTNLNLKAGLVAVLLAACGGSSTETPAATEPAGPLQPATAPAPEALKLPKTSLGKPDAAQFGEESARFDVSFTAPKGSHTVEALVDFAVCTKETCVPDQRTIALNLQVM